MQFRESIMHPMATLTLKGLPEDLLARLRTSAASDRRSINQQAILILDRALQGSAKSNFADFLVAFREEWGPGDLTEEDFAGLRPKEPFASDEAAGLS